MGCKVKVLKFEIHTRGQGGRIEEGHINIYDL